jgi:hypothetical protein
MTSARRYRICAPGVAHQTIDGEVVIVDLRSGSYYSLMDGGAEVWGLLELGASVGEIVEAFLGRYEGVPELVEADVARLVEELEAEGIIRADETIERGGTLGTVAAEKKAYAALVLDKYTDMRDLILLDPIHEVDEGGWPNPREAA